MATARTSLKARPATASVAGVTRTRIGRASSAPKVKNPPFANVKIRRVFEEICDQIRDAIEAGQLKPGDRLPAERELAVQFKASRTAVREALRSLEIAGVIFCQKGTNGGPIIKHGDTSIVTRAVQDQLHLSQISMENLTEARILLTNDAIRLACERGSKADFDAIQADIDEAERLTKSGNFTRRSTYITNFYRLLALATHNDFMVMLIESLSEIVRVQMARVSPQPRTDVISVRRKILQHLRARDADAAMAEMSRHLRKLSRHMK